MRFLNRKSKLERLLETVGDSLDPANVLKGALSDGLGSGKPLKDGLPTGKNLKAVMPRGRAVKAGLVAGGLAGLTAGSAGISSPAPQRGGGGPSVKLTKLALFAAGYVLGAKAGRERYAQIVHGAAQASEKLEAFSSRHPPSGQARGSARPDRGS